MNMDKRLQDQMAEDLKERVRHRDTILDIQAILATKNGKNFIKYLFESFEVGSLPPRGLTGEVLMDMLGFLRAGNSVFKIVAEANPEVAALLLAQIEKEKHAQNEYAEVQRS